MKKDLLVEVLTAVIENDYRWVFINKDLSIEGESSYGFITDESTHSVLDDIDLEEYKKNFGIPQGAQKVKLELGHINDILIEFNKEDFDQDTMDELADDMYKILGNKYDLMTVEAHPSRR